MKKLLLLSALLLGVGSVAATAADSTPLVINDTTKVTASGATAGTLTGQVVLQTGENTSVIYNVTTGGFTDASGKPVTLPADERRVLIASAKQALTEAAKQAQAGAYGENSPAVLAALVKTLIALDPGQAATYTNIALSGLLGPNTGLTDKSSAVNLITATATNAVSDSSLTPGQKSVVLAKVDAQSASVLAKVSNPATDVVPVGGILTEIQIPINPVDPSTISNGSGNGG